MHDRTAPRHPWDDDGLVHELASVCAVGALAGTVLLYREFQAAWIPLVVGTLAVPAYVLAVARREWRLLAGVAGITAGSLVGWAVHELTGTPSWDMRWPIFVIMACVWAPWPRLARAPATAALWVLAVAPVAAVLVNGGVGNLTWITQLATGRRLSDAGPNELAVICTVAVVAILAMRARDDSSVLLGLQVVALALAGGAGTRVVLPTLAVAGGLWWSGRHERACWRGGWVESLPWVAYAAFAIGPAAIRTLTGVGGGVNRITSGRWEIWAEYWEVFVASRWAGLGLGYTDVLRAGRLETGQPPHLVPLELGVEVGVPGGLVVLAGLTLVAIARSGAIRGPDRWLHRLPVVVLLPSLALLDLPLKRPEMVLPILIGSAALATVAGRRPPDETVAVPSEGVTEPRQRRPVARPRTQSPSGR